MKKLILLVFGISMIFFACETEQIETQTNLNLTSSDYTECMVIDADRSPFVNQQPSSNFWWSQTSDGSDYFNADTYFSSDDSNNLVFREYDDGTANILGTTVSGSCIVTVDVWLKDKKSWIEWQAIGGEHKMEGTAGNASNSEDLSFYVIDSERSSISAAGGDCVQEGDFGVRQRPDPNDAGTPNFGSHVGVGGANYDSDVNAIGLSSWAWLTDTTTGEDLWVIDFNFVIDCETPNYTECEIFDVDRSPFGTQQPISNFWWSETADGSDYFNADTYFSSDDTNNLVFREYEDGTANILGTTASGSCIVTVDVWLKDKKSWAEWQAIGGEHKKEGTAGNASNSEDMSFYVIDSERSTITAAGGDCVQEGTFGVRQRPDPNDSNTPNFGAHIGIGGANFDSDLDAVGLSSWGWLTDLNTGEDLWLIDFNFKIECPQPEPGCDTSFAKGNSDNDHACFTEAGFSRWGWNIGPLTPGTYTYDVHAGAGQCDITKGVLVGIITVIYDGTNVTASYDLINGYTNTETHLYAGISPFPLKNNGSYTVAPGQYTVQDDLNGESIYVIAHSKVCGSD